MRIGNIANRDRGSEMATVEPSTRSPQHLTPPVIRRHKRTNHRR